MDLSDTPSSPRAAAAHAAMLRAAAAARASAAHRCVQAHAAHIDVHAGAHTDDSRLSGCAKSRGGAPARGWRRGGVGCAESRPAPGTRVI